MGAVTQAVEKRDAAPAELTPKQALTRMLESNAGAVGASLPTGYKQDRFMRLLLTAANTNPDLFECTPRSFLAAGVAAAQLGLEPNDARGLAYLIPFNENKKVNGEWVTTKKVQLIIGYKGMLDLARRSGMVSSINAFPVFTGDTFTYSLGLEPTLHHVPGDHDENPDDLTHVYAVAKINGDPQFVVLTRRQVDKVMAQSKGAKSGKSPWTTHYTEMALKTALRRLCKWLPQTVEMAQADAHDEKDLSFAEVGAFDAGVIGHSGRDDDDAIEASVRPDNVDADTGEIAPPVEDPAPSADQADAEWTEQAKAGAK
jgi:recombination protein RecT